MSQVQSKWGYMEAIFMDSADIRKHLASEANMFENVNKVWTDVMDKLAVTGKCIGLLQPDLLHRLNLVGCASACLRASVAERSGQEGWENGWR